MNPPTKRGRGRPRSTGPILVATSQAQAGGLVGIPGDHFGYAKEAGAPGFRYGRVYLEELWLWFEFCTAAYPLMNVMIGFQRACQMHDALARYLGKPVKD